MILLRKPFMVACCLAILFVATLAKHNAPISVGKSKLMVARDYQAVPPGVLVGNSNIHTRSLSAWTWRVNFEEDRIPKTISEAVCSSSYCIDPESSPGWGQHEMKLNSVPIQQTQLVLRFNKTLDCYQASFIPITVGCTCTKARTT